MEFISTKEKKYWSNNVGKDARLVRSGSDVM